MAHWVGMPRFLPLSLSLFLSLSFVSFLFFSQPFLSLSLNVVLPYSRQHIFDPFSFFFFFHPSNGPSQALLVPPTTRSAFPCSSAAREQSTNTKLASTRHRGILFHFLPIILLSFDTLVMFIGLRAWNHHRLLDDYTSTLRSDEREVGFRRVVSTLASLVVGIRRRWRCVRGRKEVELGSRKFRDPRKFRKPGYRFSNYSTTLYSSLRNM